MANFNVAFLNPKLRTSSKDYGFLVDQLEIKKNQLEADGKLSPGDYQMLVNAAQEVYSHPGLSQDQRSNLQVKISQYQSDAKVTGLRDLNDLARLKRSVQDDYSKNTMLLGNNPQLLMKANADALRLKIDTLSRSIDTLNNSGDDPTNHINEFTETLNEYNDVLQAIDDMKTHQPGSKPKSNLVAYITTNASGEITDVSIGRAGSKSGYAETNGLYGGLSIYGKVNRKEFGKNIFQLGDTTFSGSDLTVQDPTTPGAFRSAPLLSQDTSGGRMFGLVPNQYKDVDFSRVRTQNGVRTGGWAQGSSGFYYYKNPDGTYTKYVNTQKEKLGIEDTNIIRIPQTFEQNILPVVSKTVDGSQPFTPPIPYSPAPQGGGIQIPYAPGRSPAQEAVTPSVSRTRSPIERAPVTAGGIASSLLQKAGGALNYLFGGGQ